MAKKWALKLTTVADACFSLLCRWFYANLSRMQAEDKLCRIPKEGVFLVRQRTDQRDASDSSEFAISFRFLPGYCAKRLYNDKYAKEIGGG